MVGCSDPSALNYNLLSNIDDGSCINIVNGCTDINSYNYNHLANTDDGTCIEVVNGCTDVDALNYNQIANTDNGTCIYLIYGCTDVNAQNYNQYANTDDGSCIYQPFGCSDSIFNNISIDLISANDSITNLHNQIDSLNTVINNSTQVEYQDVTVDFQYGWSMFGYVCVSATNVSDVFSQISDKVAVVKDEEGLVYVPEFNFNGIGDLQFAKGKSQLISSSKTELIT